MTTLLIAIGAFVGYIIAYHTYGKWLAHRIFGLDPKAKVPSEELRDNVDYVPTKKEVIFGHHFTSIAGTGPIVGPAIAVFWGWLPALLWVLFGSIFIGAVHDFGALVVSLRNRGQTVGEVAGRLITPRAKVLFLTILFFALTIVLAIFGLVIAAIFSLYPQSVLSVWIEIPIAIAIGIWVYRRGGGILIPSLIALGLLYVGIYVGAYYLPITFPESITSALAGGWSSPIILWTIILFVYCFIASVLPVWTLLQPRDFINSHQLILALSLLIIGVLVASLMGSADMPEQAMVTSAEYRQAALAPPLWPFLFITIACGAVSGFHCLVSSGTSSKQLATETDAQYVGYGAMLLEGGLAVIVILACCAGVAMGQLKHDDKGRLVVDDATGDYAYAEAESGGMITGWAAWTHYYPKTRMVKGEEKGGWASAGLGHKVGAFIEGGANFLHSMGMPLRMGVAIVAVLVASFAATTLDTATRLQRYVVQELAATVHFKPLTNKYAATAFALVIAGALAVMPGPLGPGSGGFHLWPLFGAVNQLLAGLAFLVTVFYLWRRSKPVFFALIPALIMLLLPAWAMLYQMFHPQVGWLANEKYLLFTFGCAVMGLQVWIVIEAALTWPKARGVLEKQLPPLPQAEGKLEPAYATASDSGRSC